MRQKFLKLGAFIVTGLALIAGFYTLGKSTTTTAAVNDGQAFGDWKANCTKAEKSKKQICSVIQSLTAMDKNGKKQSLLATYQFAYFDDGKELRLIQTLPQGYLIQPGSGIVAGEKIVAPGKFTLCKDGFCYAVSALDSDALKTILSYEKVNIGIFNEEGKQVNLPLSTKGLKEALEAIKQ